MSVKNAGKTIKEARIKAGLTQEQMSDGICSVLSLSRIENGSAGVCPVTFQALMEHAGQACELYPVFASRDDFDCFYALHRAQFYLNSWHLNNAFQELRLVMDKNFGDNKFHYQKWLYLLGRLQVYSGNDNHKYIYKLFAEALHVSRPRINLLDFQHMYLSTIEIQLLIALAQEAIYLEDFEQGRGICEQLSTYLNHAEIDFIKKDCLYAEYAITYAKYLLATRQYEEALAVADSNRHKMVKNYEDSSLFELTFLTSLGYYYTGQKDIAYSYFKDTFYSAYSVKSYYATMCRDFVKDKELFELDNYLSQMKDIPKHTYKMKKASNTENLADGTYDFFSPDILTIGRLIKDLRTEQGLSQTELCQGLCSKSKLSKIEHDTLQPDIFLTESMLQRLGISERIFSFWGNEHDSKLYELKFKIIYTKNDNILPNRELLSSFQALLSKNDTIPRQFYLYNCAMLEKEPKKCIEKLYEALHVTLKDFDIQHICDYRLSWNEHTILNNIAHQYRLTDTPFLGTEILQNILRYHKSIQSDLLFNSTVRSISEYMLARSLYLQKRYQELAFMFSFEKTDAIVYNLDAYSFFQFFYCQGLAEYGLTDKAIESAIFACALHNIKERSGNSEALIRGFQTDFGIDLKDL